MDKILSTILLKENRYAITFNQVGNLNFFIISNGLSRNEPNLYFLEFSNLLNFNSKFSILPYIFFTTFRSNLSAK